MTTITAEPVPVMEESVPAQSTQPQYRTANVYEKFLYGGLACMAASFVLNPVDVVKVRLQLQTELAAKSDTVVPRKYAGFTRGLYTTYMEEGISGLGRGMTASMMREASYSTIRIGAYDPIKDMLVSDSTTGGTSRGLQFPLYKKCIAGGISGAVGAAIANPTDLIKVRMQAPYIPGKSLRYANTLDAIKSIYSVEGVGGFYKGVAPTIQRACILTGTQLPAYDHSKHFLLASGYLTDGLLTHFIASMFAGLVCATASCPTDVVKSRMMNQPVDQYGNGTLYRTNLECWKVTLQREGVRGFFHGWYPSWMRLGPHTVFSFMMFEQMRRLAGLQTI